MERVVVKIHWESFCGYGKNLKTGYDDSSKEKHMYKDDAGNIYYSNVSLFSKFNVETTGDKKIEFTVSTQIIPTNKPNSYYMYNPRIIKK